jgi:hypothetical protein
MSNLIKSTCKGCNSDFLQKLRGAKYLKRFCSRSCSATFNNKKREYSCSYIKQGTCLNCNVVFNYKVNSYRGKFCSNKCSGRYRFLNNTLKEAEKGVIDQAITLKKVLVYKSGYQCSICDISEWNNTKLSLHLDHIDGNSDNNSILNLRLLCPNCHSQTDTFSGRNKKNTKRSAYNKRYRVKKLLQ